MQHLQDLKVNIFSEIKETLNSLATVREPEELIENEQKIYKVIEDFHNLKFIISSNQNNKEILHHTEEPTLYSIDNQLNSDDFRFDQIEEELILNHNAEEFLDDEALVAPPEIINPTPVADKHSDDGHNQEDPKQNTNDKPIERKIKLSGIKGLKPLQSLFDDEEPVVQEPISLQKGNMPIDFMEAEKQKPAFRLDLNDRVAFTKHLFNSDAEMLDYTIDRLNSFKKLEEAKEFLSELYYQNNWKNQDDYAQRLWSLVENKFL